MAAQDGTTGLAGRLCFSTLVCPEWTLERVIDAAASARVAGIDFRGIGPELDITRLDAFNSRLADTLTRLSDCGLSMPCLNTSVRLVEPDAGKWAGMLEEFSRYVQLAKRTGTRMIRVFGGGIPQDMTRVAARDLARGHLDELIAASGANGPAPLVESHDDWKIADTLLSLLDGLSPDRAGVLWDIEHPFRAGEPPADTLARLGAWIRHVHVKDSTLGPAGENNPALLGAGELPVADCLCRLEAAGYGGWVCLETERRWRPAAPPPEQSIPQFADFVRDALRTSAGERLR